MGGRNGTNREKTERKDERSKKKVDLENKKRMQNINKEMKKTLSFLLDHPCNNNSCNFCTCNCYVLGKKEIL